MTISVAAKPISVDLDEGVLTALDALAQSIGRNRNWVVARAVEEYLALEAWRVEHIRRAMAEADAGHLATDEEVNAIFAKWGAKFG